MVRGQKTEDVGVNKQSNRLRGAGRTLAAAVMALLVFFAGLGIGSGQLSLAKQGDKTGLPKDLDYSSVERLYDQLRANYDGDLEIEKLLDGIKAGMVEAAGDPYTVYLNAEQAAAFAAELNGTFSGIGAEIGKDEDDNLIIVSPIEGFPAAKSGLRPKDTILTIDGQTTLGMSIEEAVSKIRGPKGTNVELRILRDKKEDKTLTITREDIKIPSVKHEVLPGNVGYLQIFQFGDDAAELTKAAARDFKDKGVASIILDLRGNPGGLLDASVDVASLWLESGDIVLQQKRGDEVVSLERAGSTNTLRGLPTVVLINEGSASASEIVAGALKDHKAATLVGVKTYGKGSVQELERLRGGGELKVTIARWYRPNGENIDKKGVAPDETVEMSNEDFTTGRDPQKDAAIQFLKNR